MTAARRGASLRPMKKAKAAPKPASAQKRRSRWISIPLKVAIGFVGLSVGTVVIYRFVPPPVTLTMLLDPNGFEKDWTSLSGIDRDMVAAVIARGIVGVKPRERSVFTAARSKSSALASVPVTAER